MKKARNMKKQNLIGAVIMTGLILLAMPLGVAHSLEELRDEAEWQFYGDRTGYSIYDSLEARREAANNLLTVARKYTDDNQGLTTYVNELEYQVQASEWAYSDSHAVEAQVNFLLGEAANELAGQMESAGLSEQDEKYRVQLIAQMASEQDKIERSSYNAAALKFNEHLYVFPVNFFKHFMDVEELWTFDNYGNYTVAEEADEIEELEFFGEAAYAQGEEAE